PADTPSDRRAPQRVGAERVVGRHRDPGAVGDPGGQGLDARQQIGHVGFLVDRAGILLTPCHSCNRKRTKFDIGSELYFGQSGTVRISAAGGSEAVWDFSNTAAAAGT